jgi:hypothetical protein
MKNACKQMDNFVYSDDQLETCVFFFSRFQINSTLYTYNKHKDRIVSHKKVFYRKSITAVLRSILLVLQSLNFCKEAELL